MPYVIKRLTYLFVVDSRKGYVPGNIMFVCWAINCMKNDMSLYQFKRMCARVAA